MPINITEELVQLLNERVLYYFSEISKIPRGSGNEKAIADYLVAFGVERGLAVRRGEAFINGKQTHNVVICKPASNGYERLDTVILQAHIDMVCQKTMDSAHDFTTDSIKIIVEGDMMRADGTTLGADDGIGVAIILSILDSGAIAHPPIEALFTSDEEEGMSGAMAVDRSLITGNRLINIDAEEEGALYYGCAGGVNANFYIPITKEPGPSGYSAVQIEISGLTGGHSGLDIHKNRANAHLLMARLLRAIADAFPMRLIAFTGGDKRNVITREAGALFAVEAKNCESAIKLAEAHRAVFTREFEDVEPSITLTAEQVPMRHQAALSQDSLTRLLSAILHMPNGVQTMHTKVEGLVMTSCNLGVVKQEDDQFVLCSLVRSFDKAEKLDVLERMQGHAELAGARLITGGDYPDWKPNPDSELIARFKRAYQTAFDKEPMLESVHAGLECGYFADKFPDMDMIAFGPTITGAHSTAEKLHIKSMEKIISLLLHVLNQMDA